MRQPSNQGATEHRDGLRLGRADQWQGMGMAPDGALPEYDQRPGHDVRALDRHGYGGTRIHAAEHVVPPLHYTGAGEHIHAVNDRLAAVLRRAHLQ